MDLCGFEASLVYTEFQASQGYKVYKFESSSGLKRKKKMSGVWLYGRNQHVRGSTKEEKQEKSVLPQVSCSAQTLKGPISTQMSSSRTGMSEADYKPATMTTSRSWDDGCVLSPSCGQRAGEHYTSSVGLCETRHHF